MTIQNALALSTLLGFVALCQAFAMPSPTIVLQAFVLTLTWKVISHQ
jgi:hypothetical protein